MNYNEYQVACLPTLAVKTSLAMNLQHAAIGFATEVSEVLDIVKKTVFYDTSLQHYDVAKADRTKFIDEFGDCMWYLSIAHTYTQNEFTPPGVSIAIQDDNEVVKHLGQLHSRASSILTGALLNRPDVQDEDLQTSFLLIKSILEYLSIDIEEVMNRNIAKLRARYEKNGGNFDEACARIRDQAAERSALEN